MSTAADTHCPPDTSDRVTRGDSPPPTEAAVATRLVEAETEPFPYTKVRDWIALLPQSALSDGAFRLYYISRSVIWENAKGGPPPRPVVEITYEEYSAILGRSARTISRFAEDLFTTGLWEELERTCRSVRVPGKARPQVQTVVTIRVHDYPRAPWDYDGPVKTWDVLSAVRDTKRRQREAIVSAGGCGTTDPSTQSDQGKQSAGNDQGHAPAEEARAPDNADADIRAGQCATTDLSPRSDQGKQPTLTDHCETTAEPKPPVSVPPAQNGETAGGTDTTNLSDPRTDLSPEPPVSAGHKACEPTLKKRVEEDKTSLPPAPPAETPAAPRVSLDDELAMFSAAAVTLVGQLYDKTLTTPGLQPLSATERAGLARRIDGRLAEGWSLTRVRAVLTGGSLVGVKMPGRLWAGRLDDMPAARPTSPGGVPPQRAAAASRHAPIAGPRRYGDRRTHAGCTNDSSTLPDPNPGKARYEVPDGRGRRMSVRWADDRRVPRWCGRCSADSRCLRPAEGGTLLVPCPECHPEPDLFPAADPRTDRPANVATP